jgi:hypothetical protein
MCKSFAFVFIVNLILQTPGKICKTPFKKKYIFQNLTLKSVEFN